MLTGVDYIILVISGLSAMIGLWRGFIKEVFALGIWAGAIGLAYFFYPEVSEIIPLEKTGDSPWINNSIAAGLIVVCTLVCGGLMSFIIQQLVKVTGLSGTDRLLGLVFGFARGATIIMLLVMVLPSFTPIAKQSWWIDSQYIPIFLGFEDWARSILEAIGVWLKTVFGGGET